MPNPKGAKIEPQGGQIGTPKGPLRTPRGPEPNPKVSTSKELVLTANPGPSETPKPGQGFKKRSSEPQRG